MASNPLPDSVQKLIRSRARDRARRDAQQGVLIENREVHKATIEAKLGGLAESNQFANFIKCGKEEIFRTCKSCGRFERFYFSCNRKWCPLCNWKIGQARAAHLRAWAARIKQPKHLVLTMRNFPTLTRRKIRAFQKALLKLRRARAWASVRGGCCSMELTNEGNGWHLHAHLLLDVDWLEMPDISQIWAGLIGQEFGIVKIKDVRGTEFVQEVAKYVAKGSELAKWPGEQLLEFINAIRGVRFFATFGELRKASKEIKRELLARAPAPRECECGCGNFVFETETTSILNEIRRSKRR